MSQNIFVINPGSTSTKVAMYSGEEELFSENIVHTSAELAKFGGIPAQLPFRLEAVLGCMERRGVDPKQLDIVMGRGGMFPPVKPGAYLVDDALCDLILHGEIEQHASNLGGVLARRIAEAAGVKAFVYDCVSVDELPPICKVTGIPEIQRQSFCHVLNSKAVARRYAESIGKRYEDLRCIVAHLGGGISLSAHMGGRIVDSIADDAGPFAPERGGCVPVLYIIDMCFSGKYSRSDMIHKVRGMGGLRALLGTSDCREIESRIAAGDEKAKLIYDAMIFQIAKGVHMVSTILAGDIDAVILTGGVAFSKYVTDGVSSYISHFGKTVVIPGEFEMQALAEGGRRLLSGEVYHRYGGGDGRLV